MDSLFIPLGSGYSLPWDVHPSLALLHQLKLFNFPVPKGVILLKPPFTEGVLDEDYRLALELELKNRDFSSPLEIFLFAQASHEPFSVSLESPSDLKQEIEALLQKSLTDGESQAVRREILITEKPKPMIQGTALSQWGFLDDWITFSFLSEKEVFPENQMPLEKLTPGEKRLSGDFRGRLQELLRSVRNAMGEDNWVLTWMDNGDTIFLRSISSLKKGESWEDFFSHISLFEITQNRPSRLESNLICLSSNKLFQFFGHWTQALSPNRIWVQQQKEQLLFNYSLLEDFLRSFGLSTQGLTLLKAQPKRQPFHTNTVRFWRSLPRLLRFIHHLSLSPGIANRLSARLRTFETSPEKRIQDLFFEWQTVYVSASHCIYRIWSFYLILGSLFRWLGLPSNLLQIPSASLPSWIRWVLYPLLKFKERLILAESMLRESSQLALSKINGCIGMKSLGWFARGLVPHAESVWSLDYETVLQLDTQLEERSLKD